MRFSTIAQEMVGENHLDFEKRLEEAAGGPEP
jgi:hypothetical protein